MSSDFTKGNIMKSLLGFMAPVLGALFLQAMYGAVDLLVVGKFGTPVDVSAVGTGSQIMTTLTNLLVSFSMGTTIFLGQTLGEGKPHKGGDIIGNSILLFFDDRRMPDGAAASDSWRDCRRDECAGGSICPDGGVYPHLRGRFHCDHCL